LITPSSGRILFPQKSFSLSENYFFSKAWIQEEVSRSNPEDHLSVVAKCFMAQMMKLLLIVNLITKLWSSRQLSIGSFFQFSSSKNSFPAHLAKKCGETFVSDKRLWGF